MVGSNVSLRADGFLRQNGMLFLPDVLGSHTHSLKYVSLSEQGCSACIHTPEVTMLKYVHFSRLEMSFVVFVSLWAQI